MEKFACIVADPPWQFGDSLPGKSRGATKNYKTMPIEDIRRLVLPPHFDNCYLFLWRVSAMVEEAYSVVRAWGFEPKSEVVWAKYTNSHAPKPHFGMGRHVRAAHETCIVAVKGKPIHRSDSIRSILHAPIGDHSEKPDSFYYLVTQVCFGPYVDLFARKERPGWTCIGDALGMEILIK
jgi:N6-adenosine-specific RNA methylase IME4